MMLLPRMTTMPELWPQCLSTKTAVIPMSIKKHSSGEKYMRDEKLSECQIRGWRAVSVVFARKDCFVHRLRYAYPYSRPRQFVEYLFRTNRYSIAF